MVECFGKRLRSMGQQVACIILVALLSACGTTVNVPPTALPDALVEPYQLSAGLRLQEALKQYRYEETLPSGEEYAINIGPAAESALTDTFADMFDRLVLVDAGEPIPDGLDLLIDSDIEALEFALPSQTVTEDYAVWIKFKMKVYDDGGALQAEFPLSAYGKATRDSIVSGQNAALTSAANLALRDAAVLLLTRFEAQSLLVGKQLPAAEPDSALPLADDRDPQAPTEAETNAGGLAPPPEGEQFL